MDIVDGIKKITVRGVNKMIEKDERKLSEKLNLIEKNVEKFNYDFKEVYTKFLKSGIDDISFKRDEIKSSSKIDSMLIRAERIIEKIHISFGILDEFGKELMKL